MNYDIAIISLFFKLRMLDKNIAIDKNDMMSDNSISQISVDSRPPEAV